MDIQIKSPVIEDKSPKIYEDYEFVGLDVIFFDYKFNIDGKEFYEFYFRPNYRCDMSYGVEIVHPYIASFLLNTNSGLETLKNEDAKTDYWLTKEQTTVYDDFYGTEYWESVKIPTKNLLDMPIKLEYKLVNKESGKTWTGKLTLNTNKNLQMNKDKLNSWSLSGFVSIFIKWSNESEDGVCYPLIDEKYTFSNIDKDYYFKLNKSKTCKKLEDYFDVKDNAKLAALIKSFMNNGLDKNKIEVFNFNDNELKKYYDIKTPELLITKINDEYEYKLKPKTIFDFDKKIVRSDDLGEEGVITNPYFKGNINLKYEINIDDVLFEFTRNWVEDKNINKMIIKSDENNNLKNSQFIKWEVQDIDKLKKLTFEEFKEYFNE